ncbi:DNA repair exonuclease [Sporosarcina sp. ACRSL]|uniref:metallophosphoesterase family protein n=1 Tax=Sporosarcina sp. ACRSL TaxID=2918215 RepID=UPI001EF461AE|nr:DNA repair exonuclease [Sporosarcina sp. ACRSL]MCG7345584.1 DNA repair exonuclease [Sporosarcina sp. ACRSL]
MSTIRFIHTADLHLDSPFKGMTGMPPETLNELRESTFTAFNRLIEYALETSPDFLLIVGDLYDGEDRSLRAQRKFQEGMLALHEAGIPVYISYGNHDHLSGNWTRFELPPNVYEFPAEVAEVSLSVRGKDVVLHGFSYPNRHVREETISKYPVASDHHSFHIGLLHGSLAGNETHAVYSPFTIGDLQSKRYDYWALGHIHQRQQLSNEPPVVYPGNLQGRHRNEAGEKGFYEVELSKSDSILTFIPTSAVHFGRLQIPCTRIHHANEWLAVCEEALLSYASKYGPSVIDVEVLNLDDETAAFFSQTVEEIWLDALREVMDGQEPFIWVQRLTRKDMYQNRENNALVESVLEQVDSWSTDEWKRVLGGVYQHVRTARYLEPLTEEDISDLRDDVERLLLNELPTAMEVNS